MVNEGRSRPTTLLFCKNCWGMKPKKHTQLQTVCHYRKWKGSKLIAGKVPILNQHPLQTICNMSEDVQYKRECAV